MAMVAQRGDSCLVVLAVYHVYMKDGDKFLLAAKKRSKQRTSNYLISKNKDDLSRTGTNFMGKLRSNFVGTEFTVYDSGLAPKDSKGAQNKLRKELALVTYVRPRLWHRELPAAFAHGHVLIPGVPQASNVLGSKGPRKMKVCVPKVNPSNNQRVEFKPLGADGEMVQQFKADDRSQMVYMINKPPRWNEGTTMGARPRCNVPVLTRVAFFPCCSCWCVRAQFQWPRNHGVGEELSARGPGRPGECAAAVWAGGQGRVQHGLPVAALATPSVRHLPV